MAKEVMSFTIDEKGKKIMGGNKKNGPKFD